MTTYVADCSPYFYLWGDTHAEAELMASIVGHSMAQAPWSWGCFALSEAEATEARAYGSQPRDRFGPAEWCAVRDQRPRMVEAIQKARSQGCV